MRMTVKKQLFSYNFNNEEIETYIDIPCNTPIDEIVQRLITKHKLPVYIDEVIERDLDIFIKKHTSEYYNGISLVVQNAKSNIAAFEDVSKHWEKIMREEMAEFGERRCASNEELFATVYHKMVHSPALETMLQLEYMYAQIVRKKCNEKDKQVEDLRDRQAREMANALDRLEEDITESKINELAVQHFEDQMFLEGQLRSELDTIKVMQRREYREWLMQMLEQKQAHSSLTTPSSPSTPAAMVNQIHYGDGDKNMSYSPILEESFTIHLGSQLKQMHNIRILSANVMNLCSVHNEALSPQLLQTSLALYSNDMHGLVLIDNNIIQSEFSKDFRDICQRSTEFHFNHIDDQLEKIAALKEQSKPGVKTKNLSLGDFYITKQANLSQVHVVFHIITDDSIRSNDINSRHPVVLGLRNILKTSCSNDITSLTIPLLLEYELSEEMTISWCEKRAELVFKCVKGFMIEMATWGGSDMKNLQFLLPEGISCEVFQSLTEMLPRIFKVSNPLMLKSKK